MPSVPLKEVRPYQGQPRKHFSEKSLQSLSRSIKKEGQKQPILVHRVGKGEKHKYEIVDGERRWRACKIAGLTTIDVTVAQRMNEGRKFLTSLIANFHREDHTPMEISHALEKMRAQGMTGEQIADALGKPTGWVQLHLSFQRLSVRLQGLLEPDTPEEKRLNIYVAGVLASIPDKNDQERGYREALRHDKHLDRMQVIRRFAQKHTDGPRRGRRPLTDGEIFEKGFREVSHGISQLGGMRNRAFLELVMGKTKKQIIDIVEEMEECSQELKTLSLSIRQVLRKIA